MSYVFALYYRKNAWFNQPVWKWTRYWDLDDSTMKRVVPLLINVIGKIWCIFRYQDVSSLIVDDIKKWLGETIAICHTVKGLQRSGKGHMERWLLSAILFSSKANDMVNHVLNFGGRRLKDDGIEGNKDGDERGDDYYRHRSRTSTPFAPGNTVTAWNPRIEETFRCSILMRICTPLQIE